MASWMSYLHFTASILVLYWLYVGFQALVVRGKRQAFRLEQRRRAGIPDSDNRPFDIAQADALQKKRQRDLARAANAATPTATTTASSTKDYFGRGSPSLAIKRASQHLTASPYSPRRPNVVAPSTSSHLSPGQSSRYNPASYRAPAAAPGYHRHSPYDGQSKQGQELDTRGAAAKEMEQRRAASNVATAAAAVVAQRGKKRGADEARDAGQEDSVIGGARRGKKGRSYQQTELGTAMDEDEEGDLEGDDEDYVPTDSETEMASVGAGSGDVEDELLDDEEMDDYIPPSRTPANLLPRSRHDRSKAAAQRSRRSRMIKKEPRDRSLAEAMTRHSSDDGDGDDDDVSMRTAQRPNASTRRQQSPIPDSDRSIGEEWHDPTSGFQHRMDLDTVLTDEEVSPGHKRRVTAQRRVKRRLTVKLEWRPKHVMPADSEHPDRGEVVPHYVPAWLSEAEIEESRRKGELGEQAALRQQQQAAKEAATAADRLIGGSSSTGSSPRNGAASRQLDSLLYQPPHRIPLRSPLSKSKLSLAVAGSPLSSPARSRSATPDVSFGGGAAGGGSSRGSPATATSSSSRSSYTNGRGRLSLGTAGGSSTSLANLAAAAAASPSTAAGGAASPLRNRALDAAGKRRREEELMKRIRQAREDKERVKKEEEEEKEKDKAKAPFSFGSPATATTSTTAASSGAPAPVAPSNPAAASSSSNGGFTFGAPSSQPSGAAKTDTKPAAAAAAAAASSSSSSSPFSFGAPKPAAAPSPAAAPAVAVPASSTAPSPFSFGSGQAKPAAAPTAPTPAAAAGGGGAPAQGASSSPFSFGSSKPPAPAVAPTSSSSTPWSFNAGSGGGGGATNKPPAAAPASSSSSTPFTFGAPNTTNGTAAPAAPAAGGASTSSPSPFNFGAPPAAATAASGGGAGGGGGFSFSFGKK